MKQNKDFEEGGSLSEGGMLDVLLWHRQLTYFKQNLNICQHWSRILLHTKSDVAIKYRRWH